MGQERGPRVAKQIEHFEGIIEEGVLEIGIEKMGFESKSRNLNKKHDFKNEVGQRN